MATNAPGKQADASGKHVDDSAVSPLFEERDDDIAPFVIMPRSPCTASVGVNKERRGQRSKTRRTACGRLMPDLPDSG